MPATLGPMSGASGGSGSKAEHNLSEGNSGGLGAALNKSNSLVGEHKLQHVNVGSLIKKGTSTHQGSSKGSGRKGD